MRAEKGEHSGDTEPTVRKEWGKEDEGTVSKPWSLWRLEGRGKPGWQEGEGAAASGHVPGAEQHREEVTGQVEPEPAALLGSDRERLLPHRGLGPLRLLPHTAVVTWQTSACLGEK